MAMAVVAVDRSLMDAVDPWPRLAVLALLGASTYAGLMLVFRPAPFGDLVAVISRYRARGRTSA
jgi:hypothetical protein